MSSLASSLTTPIPTPLHPPHRFLHLDNLDLCLHRDFTSKVAAGSCPPRVGGGAFWPFRRPARARPPGRTDGGGGSRLLPVDQHVDLPRLRHHAMGELVLLPHLRVWSRSHGLPRLTRPKDPERGCPFLPPFLLRWHKSDPPRAASAFCLAVSFGGAPFATAHSDSKRAGDRDGLAFGGVFVCVVVGVLEVFCSQ